jgi:hypothetical protein
MAPPQDKNVRDDASRIRTGQVANLLTAQDTISSSRSQIVGGAGLGGDQR